MYTNTQSYSTSTTTNIFILLLCTSTTTNIFILLLFKYKNTNKCAQQEFGGGAPERLREEARIKCSI